MSRLEALTRAALPRSPVSTYAELRVIVLKHEEYSESFFSPVGVGAEGTTFPRHMIRLPCRSLSGPPTNTLVLILLFQP